MTFSEVDMDLFSSNSNAYLAHCISSDFAMGAGIAKTFTYKGVRDTLFKLYTPTWDDHGYSLFTPMTPFLGVYNLVTKHRFYDKPTYQTLRESLTDMKQKLPNDCNLNMPCIGSGLDKLDWTQVKQVILDVFFDTNINITICHYQRP